MADAGEQGQSATGAADMGTWGSVSGSGRERMYTTKEGDTLEDIAAFFYGDSTQKQRLLDDNPELHKDMVQLSPGMQLRVSEDAQRGDVSSS